MATDDEVKEGAEGAPETTVPAVVDLAEFEAIKSERDRLRVAREEKSREAEKFRKDLQALRQSKAVEPSVEDLQRERDDLQRRLDELSNARVKDRQDLAIAKLAGKYLAPDFHDLAPDLIDRSLLDIDDDGQIVSGLDAAYTALVKRRPAMAIPKKSDPGTPKPRRVGGGSAGAASDEDDPLGMLLGKKTILGT